MNTFKLPHILQNVTFSSPEELVATEMAVTADTPTRARMLVMPKHIHRSAKWGMLPSIAVTSATAFFILALAIYRARNDQSLALPIFWIGIFLLFIPISTRLVMPEAQRSERMGLTLLLSLLLYLVKIMLSPIYFNQHDEFIHQRTVLDITQSSHLFTSNPLIPASPVYPGLEIVTHLLSQLSGLDVFASGLIIIGIARLLLILSLFYIYELTSKSAYLASIATLIYVTNPHMFFFDAQFSYQSLALPLGCFVVFALARWGFIAENRYRMLWIAWIGIGAVVITHHITSFILVAFLFFWGLIYTVLPKKEGRQHSPYMAAIFGLFIAITWLVVFGTPVIEYLGSFIGVTATEIGHILSGAGGSRKLFTDGAGQTTPVWDRINSLASVAIISLGIPVGLFVIWKRYRRNVLAVTLGIAALGYPASQLFRLTPDGAEATDRLASFLFVAVSFALAALITMMWPFFKEQWQLRTVRIVTVIFLQIMLLGGIALGANSNWALLPGPYLVAADQRSIEPEGISTANWTQAYLGPNNPIFADRINRLLLATYGDQQIVTHLQTNLDLTPIYFSTTFTNADLQLLYKANVHYLVVDKRLSQGLPRFGIYFEQGEYQAFQHLTPINPAALAKFDAVPQLQRIYDSGDIIIYQVMGGTTNATH